MGMGGPMDKAGMTQRLALDDAALKLSAEQKGRIDKILDGYIAEQGKMRAGMQPGSPPNPEMMGTMRAAREKLNADIGAVLNDGQKSDLAGRDGRASTGGPAGWWSGRSAASVEVDQLEWMAADRAASTEAVSGRTPRHR